MWCVRDAGMTAYPFSDNTRAQSQLGSHATLAFLWGVCVCVPSCWFSANLVFPFSFITRPAARRARVFRCGRLEGEKSSRAPGALSKAS